MEKCNCTPSSIESKKSKNNEMKMKSTIVTRKMLDSPFESLSEVEQEAVREWNTKEARLEEEFERAREHISSVCKRNLLAGKKEKRDSKATSSILPPLAAGWIQPLEHLFIQLEALNFWLASYGLRICLDSCNDHAGLPKVHWHLEKFQRNKTLNFISKLCEKISKKLESSQKGKEGEGTSIEDFLEEFKKTLASDLSAVSIFLGKHRETLSSKVISEAVSCLCEKLIKEARSSCESRCKHCGADQPVKLYFAEDLSFFCKRCAAASGLQYRDPDEHDKVYQNNEVIEQDLSSFDADETEEGL